MKLCKRVWRGVQILLALLLALLLLANFWVLGAKALTKDPAPTFLGFHWAVVLSGSMEPEISVGDFIVSQARLGYQVGDIVTYRGERSLTTHRIIAVTPEGFTTQGDANNAPDSRPVAPDRVVGKVLFTIPQVGRIITALRSPLGLTVLVLAAFAMLELPHLFHRKNSEE